MEKQKLKMYSLEDMKNKYVGTHGTQAREQYEYELRMEVISEMIRKTRQERQLTQEELGNLVGVKKAQISKLENNANSATIDTIVRVFKAMQAEINFSIKLENKTLQVA
ncbi:MAG: helix-turn-helix domain-containing protein [Saprospiraceae bacterium]